MRNATPLESVLKRYLCFHYRLWTHSPSCHIQWLHNTLESGVWRGLKHNAILSTLNVKLKSNNFHNVLNYFSSDLLRPFPTEDSVKDEDIYNHLVDLIEYVTSVFFIL